MRKLYYIALALVLAACTKYEQVGDSKLVVEGWIENGGHPMVMVSESIGIATGKDMYPKDLLEHLAKWAKVTVSDGEQTEILTGIMDSRYFPPYIYTSSKITGQVGKTYTLTVEYKDYKVEATTTIPEPVPIQKVYIQNVADSLVSLRVGFVDPPKKGHYYKVFTQTEQKDSHFHPSAFTTMSDENLSGYTEASLYSTQRLMDYIDMPNIYVGDVIKIKLCTMERNIYEYWNNFEMAIASNILNTFYEHDLTRNMTGGVGYWAGYGVDSVVEFTVTDHSAYLESE